MYSFSVNVGRAKAWLRNRFPLLLILDLVVSHSIVEYATVCILMIYLMDWLGKDLATSAVIVNALDVLSAVFVFLAAYIGSNFNIIVFSNGCYTMGLIVLWITAWFHVDFDICLAVLLIALGRSSRYSNLRSFLSYQLRHRNTKTLLENQEQQIELGTNIWWYGAWIFGYIIVLSVHNQENPWLKNIKISALLMGVASILFLNLGIALFAYNKTKPAARISLSHTREKIKVFIRSKVTIKNKSLLLFSTFIPYGLVLATGNTLFIQQINNMDIRIGHNLKVPPPFFFVVKSITCDMAVFLFWYFTKSANAKHRGCVTLPRMGAGILCGVLCCIVARHMEIIRQRKMISVLLLTPQYCLLGLMEGLAGGGLFAYVVSRLKPSKKRFAEAFSELVVCVGKIFSIPFVLIFSGLWFDYSNDVRQLDRYFLLLAVMMSGSFLLYLVWAVKYADSEDNSELLEPETVIVVDDEANEPEDNEVKQEEDGIEGELLAAIQNPEDVEPISENGIELA